MFDLDKKVKLQKDYFATNETKNIKFRIQKLKKLKKAIKLYESQICEALEKDLGKCEMESYMTEIGMVLDDLRYIIKHLKKWSKKQYHVTPISQFPSTSFRIAEPYGCVLIIAPWNYPFLLIMQPLVGAISAGNCAILKPSEYSKNTSEIIKKMINEVFEEKYVNVILGDKDVSENLLKNRFDYIFYTGGINVGKIIMQNASRNLTPVTLELGGKSPCIVDDTASIKLSAKRIIFGKLLNCGQTCVAPDYVLVNKKVKNEFIKFAKEYIDNFLGKNPLQNIEYPKIISEKHFSRISKLMENETILYGGKSDENSLKIEPTILDIKNINSEIMQEEIFGPILPIIEYENIEDAISYIKSHEKPLALYLFTNSKKIENMVLYEVSFGGGCINDTIIHLASSKLGFGGVGFSGMGEYHGENSFKTFSHYKSVLKKSVLLDLPMRYHPYKKINDKLIRMFMR